MREVEVNFEGIGAPVDGYAPGGFRIAGAVWRGPVAILPAGAAAWAGLPDLAPFLARADAIDILLVGMGAAISLPDATFSRQRAVLEAAGIGVEIMATPPACRTYNVLLAEGRRVAAALMPI
jgi:uncharacterized protein